MNIAHLALREREEKSKGNHYVCNALCFENIIPAAVNPPHAMHLLDMGGTLAVVTRNDGMMMIVFVLQDQKQDVCMFQCRHDGEGYLSF